MPDQIPEIPTEEPTGTRAALLAAGLYLFGHKGFAATSTRELAERAETNIASISYHFGGKDGLRLGCAAEVARRMMGVIGQPDQRPPASPEAAVQRLEVMVRALVGFLVGSHQADDLATFILREIAVKGPVLDLLYGKMIGPKHREICGLWAMATGQDAESDAVKLAVFAFLGQVIYFRIGQEIVARRMGWDEAGPRPVHAIAELIVANLHTLLEKDRRS